MYVKYYCLTTGLVQGPPGLEFQQQADVVYCTDAPQ